VCSLNENPKRDYSAHNRIKRRRSRVLKRMTAYLPHGSVIHLSRGTASIYSIAINEYTVRLNGTQTPSDVLVMCDDEIPEILSKEYDLPLVELKELISI